MFKNKFLIFIILIFALVSIGVASAEDVSSLNTTDTQDSVSVYDESNNDLNNEVTTISEDNNSNSVNSIEDSGDVNSQLQSSSNDDVIKDSNKNFNDLQKEINNKSDNSVLDLDCDYTYDGTGNFGGITISKNNFTIDGHGHTIDANAGSKNVIIFKITRDITLKNLTLINSYNTYYSYGAVCIYSGKFVYINNCTFINNTGLNGGAIYCNVHNAYLTVSNSTFINNRANGDGGAICSSSGSLTVSNSTFINNSAPSKGGGAIGNSGGTGLTVSNSTFINNTADYDGGGAIRNYGTVLTVSNSTFINNTAFNTTAKYSNQGIAGAIYDVGGTGLTVSNSTFINNNASSGAGAIYGSGSFTVSNSTFINNVAGQSGGAIYAKSNLKVNNSTFINNVASYGGGAIYGGGSFTVSNSTFINNVASYGGGAIYGADLMVSNSTFTNNRANQGAAIYNSKVYSVRTINNKYSGIADDNTYIYNEGTIITPVTITVLGNQTIKTKLGEEMVLFATITTEDGATVSGGILKFIVNDTTQTTEAISNKNGNYTLSYTVPSVNGKYLVNATYAKANIVTTKTGILDVGNFSASTDVIITVDDSISYGENATIKVKVTTESGSVTGNVTVFVDGKEYKIVDLTNSEANLNITGLGAGEHKIGVTYNGNDNYDTSSNNATVNVNSVAPTITIESSQLVYGEKGTITVTVNKHLNGTIPTGNVTISVGGKTQDVKLVNGVATLSVYGLTGGEHNVEVTYNSDNKNYTTNSNSTLVDVGKASSKVDVNVNQVVYGENATIKVNITKGATGNVTITIDNKKYDPVKLNNGEATLIVSGLSAGEHSVNVTYSGDSNYETSNITDSFSIAKVNADMVIKVLGDVQSRDNIPISVILPNDATGYVNITVGDKKYLNQDVVNGIVNITVDHLEYGTYDITALYGGDGNYNAAKANSSVFVPKVDDYGMNITVNPTAPGLGDDVVIIVNVPKNATGEVVISVDGKDYTVPVNNGVANVTIANVTIGEHIVVANYSGDNQYVSKNTTTSFNVGKASSKVDVNVNEVVFGENVTIKVNVTKGATGNVTITIDNKKYDPVKLNNGEATLVVFGLSAGEHSVNVTYNGDSNYETSNTTDSFSIAKADVSMVIKVLGDVQSRDDIPISVILPSDATGYVNITIGNKKYSNQTVVNGIVNITVDHLEYGTYDITALYGGDSNYNSAKADSSVFVPKVDDYGMNITVNPTAPGLGDDVVVIVNVPKNATGEVVISVDGKDYTVPVNNGVANVTIANVTIGEHIVVANYSGDNQYVSKNTTTSFNVGKASSKVDVNVNEVVFGENVTIKVNVTSGATGNVTITVDNKKYDSINLINGEAVLVVSGLSAGEHSVNVTYSGDSNYETSNTMDSFSIAKANASMVIKVLGDVQSRDNIPISVILPNDATGYVNITVGDKEYLNQDVVNGIVNITVDHLEYGTYDITALYGGDGNYNAAKADSSVFVPKVDDYEMNITVNPTAPGLGDDVVVIVNVPKNATGEVIITVDGKNYTVPVNNGTANITITNITAGEHNITANYTGDNQYTSKNTTTSFNISKEDAILVVKIDDIKICDSINITATLTGINNTKLNGVVNVKINNKTYTVVVIDGTGSIIGDVFNKSGINNFTATWAGDNNYNPITEEGNFNVSKITDYNMAAKVDDIKVGENATITVTLPTDAEGDVSIIIGGKSYNVTVKDGSAVITVPGLSAGDYSGTVVYSGDDKYTNKTAGVAFKVSKVSDYDMNVTVPDTKVGENTTIIVELPDDATGNVTVTVDGKNYTAPVENGTANITIPSLPEGEYNVTINYSGDDKYVPNSTDDVIKVSKVSDYNMTAKADGGKVGENATITVSLPVDAKGDVSIIIGGKSYNVTVKDGSAVITVPGLSAGDYSGTVVYSGDDKYTNKTADVAFKVSKVSDYDMNVTSPDEVKEGENTTIIVDLPDGATGNVTVIVDGKNYTGKVENGTANITIPDLPEGDHNIIINYTGDDKYEPTTTNKTITVTSNGVNLTANDLVMIYKDGSRLYATLLDSKGSPIANATIFFTINGVTYNKTTDVNGSASLAINLDYGTYVAVVSYDENNTVNATVIVKPSIIGNDLVKMWMNGTQFYATFLGKGATPLANTNVTFNINGVFYTRQTNENGTAKLNINLDPGSYILTAYNPFSKEQRGFNVLVKPLIETSDLTKYYNNGSKFEAKVYNYDGSLAANKSVTFNIHGVFYTRTSDENGIVKLAITLRPGDYIITSMYEGLSIGNKVKVIPTLETSDLSMTQDDGSTFNVRTLDGQGNPLANQNLTFNIHGVFYHKTTDSNGVAKLNINLMKGEYIITSYWKDYEIGNKISIS